MFIVVALVSFDVKHTWQRNPGRWTAQTQVGVFRVANVFEKAKDGERQKCIKYTYNEATIINTSCGLF